MFKSSVFLKYTAVFSKKQAIYNTVNYLFPYHLIKLLIMNINYLNKVNYLLHVLTAYLH